MYAATKSRVSVTGVLAKEDVETTEMGLAPAKPEKHWYVVPLLPVVPLQTPPLDLNFALALAAASGITENPNALVPAEGTIKLKLGVPVYALGEESEKL